ncbi:hypothetical protein M885DRAFT_44884 [Pelagophyceae sp. CCMP2097]|nr:hypothetical protein M885DRAFT_44884 [Pelagophyceae sp. CCMP2097]
MLRQAASRWPFRGARPLLESARLLNGTRLYPTFDLHVENNKNLIACTTLDDILNIFDRRGHAFNATNLATAVHRGAKAPKREFRRDSRLEKLFQRAADNIDSDWKPRELSNVAWGAAKLQGVDNTRVLLEAVAVQASEQVRFRHNRPFRNLVEPLFGTRRTRRIRWTRLRLKLSRIRFGPLLVRTSKRLRSSPPSRPSRSRKSRSSSPRSSRISPGRTPRPARRTRRL